MTDITALRRELLGLARIWALLMILLAATVGLAFVPLGWGNSIVSLAIAVAKAMLVMIFYMELREPHPVLRAACVAAAMALAIMLALGAVDVLLRAPVIDPPLAGR